MPGCGCAGPSSGGRPVNVPQDRGYIPASTGGQMSNSKPSTFSAPAPDPSASSAGADSSSQVDITSDQKPQPSATGRSTSSKVRPNTYKSPLRTFDTFATRILRQKAEAEEDFPKLSMPTFRGLHKCKVSSLNYHQVDMQIELEQELRNIGIQGTMMMEQLEKLLKAEAACQFQGAVRAAELAAMAAPNGLAEEAAVAASRGYSVDAQQFSRMATGDNPIEIVGYIGCTRPDNF